MKLARALSRRIKALRDAAGLSQQEVAVRGGLSLSLVAKLEQGKKADPRASTLLALGEALGVRPGALLDDLLGPEEPSPNGQADVEEGERVEKKKKKGGKKKKKKT